MEQCLKSADRLGKGRTFPGDRMKVPSKTGAATLVGKVVGFSQHANPEYQRLRVIPGAGVYPLVSAYNQRRFGVGQRGAAFVIQITAGTAYTQPLASTIPQ